MIAELLPVSIASHCSLMTPAQEGFRRLLDDENQCKLVDPTIPILSGVTADPLTTASQLKDSFVDGLTSTVKFRQCVERDTSLDFIELSA